MTEVLCHVEWCDRPVPDAYVCSTCAHRHDRNLANIPAYEPELDITLAKLRTNFTNGEGGASRETPLPINGNASEAAYVLRNTLTTWLRLVAEERGYTPNDGIDTLGYPHMLGYAPPRQRLLPGHDHDAAEPTMADMSRWLLSETEWLRHHRAGHEAVEELDAAVRNVARIVDRSPARIYVGPCHDCGADLYGREGAVMVECRPCGLEYPVAEMQEWMKSKVYGRLVTAREGAALLSRFGLETKQATIDTWVQRGRLVPRGHNAESHRLYLFDDLVTLAARAQRPDTPSERVAV